MDFVDHGQLDTCLSSMRWFWPVLKRFMLLITDFVQFVLLLTLLEQDVLKWLPSFPLFTYTCIYRSLIVNIVYEKYLVQHIFIPLVPWHGHLDKTLSMRSFTHFLAVVNAALYASVILPQAKIQIFRVSIEYNVADSSVAITSFSMQCSFPSCICLIRH